MSVMLSVALTAAQGSSAGEHLMAARMALDRLLNTPAPTAETLRKLADIDAECRALQSAASAGSREWEAHYLVIDRLSAELLKPTVPAGVFGAVGTSGTIGTPTMTVNAYMTADLLTFRTEPAAFDTAFAAAMAAAAWRESSQETRASTIDPAILVALDSVSAMLDAALKASANPSSATVAVDRGLLQQMRRQLDQVRQSLKKP